MEEWISREFSELNFGDKRLDKRTKKILSTLSKEPTASIPSNCKGWHETKAAYRYFDNPKVNAEKILMPHKQATIERVKKHNCVFMIQDTTELNYTGQKNKKGVGPSHHAPELSLFLHPSIIVSEKGICLGVYDDYQWHRESLLTASATKQQLNNDRLHKKFISEKESYRWLLGYRKATELAKKCPETQVIMIADRESDVYDLYEEANNTQEQKADWLIRLKIKNRALINESGKRDDQLLHEKFETLKPIQTIEFNLPKRNGEKGRKVQQELRMTEITLHPPTGRRGKLRCHPVKVTVLSAKEINIPPKEKAIDWWLITSIEINKIGEPLKLITYYLKRWQVEIYFRILKSGCQVEKLQLETEKRTRACLAIYLIIAWRILFLTSACQHQPDILCTEILETKEWTAAWLIIKKKTPPNNPISLKKAIILIAQMGGYLARKNDPPPGPKVLWLGLTQLYHAINYAEIVNEVTYG